MTNGKELVLYSDVLKWRGEWECIKLYQLFLAFTRLAIRLDSALGIDPRGQPAP